MELVGREDDKRFIIFYLSEEERERESKTRKDTVNATERDISKFLVRVSIFE